MQRPKKIFLVIAGGLVLMGIFNLFAIPDISRAHPIFMTIPRLLMVNVLGFALLAILAATAFIRLVRFNRMKYWENFYRRMGGEFQKGASESSGNNPGSTSSYSKSANGTSAEEMKDLYRELMKKYHPDFARGEEDKKFRTDLTAKINKAYKEGDIETLKLFR